MADFVCKREDLAARGADIGVDSDKRSGHSLWSYEYTITIEENFFLNLNF